MHKIVSIILILFLEIIFPANFALADLSSFDAEQICPVPPQENSPQFELDNRLYQQNKALRNTERGKLAAADAEIKNFCGHFSKAAGFEISKTTSQNLYNLLHFVLKHISQELTQKIKNKYNRTRPYVLYNERTCLPNFEEELKNDSSFPSGHSAWGWSLALVLAELLPEYSAQIIKRGYELGQSRVICGCHWQSDVDASRIVAAAFVANLHASSEFQDLFRKAKEELRKK